jgi:beta-mannosidase
MFWKKEIALTCILYFFITNSIAQTITQQLNNNWAFSKNTENKFYKANIPGCVHTDLMANNLIPDPFYRDNETKVQWVNTTDWQYQTSFSINKEIWHQKHIELVFEGLDTYAKVFLNDSFILETNNMFRLWKIDIKSIAKEKQNRLKIIFSSAQKVVDSLAKKELPNIIPDQSRVYTRKAAYQFGWDFATKLVTCGIWKNVFLEGWSNFKIENISYKILQLDTTIAKIEVSTLLNSDKDINKVKRIYLSEEKKYNNQNALVKNYQLIKGTTTSVDTITYYNPKIWHPNGDGVPFRYDLCIEIDNIIYSKKIGLRTIELITKPDSLSDFASLKNKNGIGFYFNVNGKPTFVKGANFVPADMFPSRVTKEKYRALLIAAKEANMNMLRVWGGGIYEADDFYNLCDSLGIMVWQDFMFACSMLPTDDAFTRNVAAEAQYQVQRLAHHPCIALWCGNNEINEGWHNWNWQKQFNISNPFQKKLWNTYTSIFDTILPKAVKENHANCSYWASSPSIGWGRKESLTQGDCHYWGVWWGLEPIETYTKKVPRFMSEYGMQSMPAWGAIEKFSLPQDWDTTSMVMKVHQKHPTGYKNLQVYLDRKYKKAVNFKDFVTQTQEHQALTYKMAIEAHMGNSPYTMGTLLWQLNDPWPVASWSIIDYYGNKKAAYFQVKESYKRGK